MISEEEWILRFKKIHGDKYIYYEFNIHNSSKQKIRITCPKHGDFYQTPKEHYKGKGCYKCGKESMAKTQSLTTEECINRFKLKHGDKYDYSKVSYVKENKKVLIGCKNHENIFWFYQTPIIHWKGSGCPECTALNGGRRKTKEEFINKSKELNNDKYDYSLVNYINNKIPIKLICKKHNYTFEQTPCNHLNLKQGCPLCRESLGEKEIKNFLENNNISFEIQKTYKELYDKNIKAKLRYDFYLPKYNLLIEYNGIQHYKFQKYFQKNINNFYKQKHHDWLKRKYAMDNNINLLIISYKEIKNINKILEENLREF